MNINMDINIIIKKFIKDIYDINFNLNNKNDMYMTQNKSKIQHKLLEDILLKYNFLNLNNKKKEIRDMLKKDELILEDGLYYIEEINGSQNTPDFLLINCYKDNYKILKIECKRGKKTIMWNDGYPLKDTIYLFTCNFYNKTILIKGSDSYLMTKKEKKLIRKNKKKLKKLNVTNKNNTNGLSINIFNRTALSQKIDINKYNEEDKEKIKNKVEKKIIKFFKNNIFYKNIMDDIKYEEEEKEEIKYNNNKKFKSISLFSGCGGDTLGMINAGIDVVGFVENDETAIKSHKKNFPESKLIKKDIKKINKKDLKDYINKIDIIFGGIPCQSFSRGGKKKQDDPRSLFFYDMARVVDIVKPKWIVIENVRGIYTSKINNQPVLTLLIKEFNRINYNIKYKLLNSSKFGVPQKRERIIMIGYNKKFNINEINIPENSNIENKYLKDILEFSLENAYKVEKNNILKLIPNNLDYFIHDLNNKDEPNGKPPSNLLKCYNFIDKSGLSFKTRKKPDYSCIVDIHDFSKTILCTYNRMPRLFIPIKNFNGVYIRPYTINELKAIQGFPNDFIVEGDYINKIKQIGNAVPPIMIQKIMEYIISIS